MCNKFFNAFFASFFVTCSYSDLVLNALPYDSWHEYFEALVFVTPVFVLAGIYIFKLMEKADTNVKS